MLYYYYFEYSVIKDLDSLPFRRKDIVAANYQEALDHLNAYIKNDSFDSSSMIRSFELLEIADKHVNDSTRKIIYRKIT